LAAGNTRARRLTGGAKRLYRTHAPRRRPRDASAHPRIRGQCTVHTMHGSKERTTCWTATGTLSPGATGVPASACSSAPGMPSRSRGEKFQVVGAMIW